MPTINRKTNQPIKNTTKSDRQIYNSSRWRNLKNEYLQNHPLCEKCLSDGIVKPAEDVHHKIPILRGYSKEQQFRLGYDYNNLMALCKKCHAEIHKTL